MNANTNKSNMIINLCVCPIGFELALSIWRCRRRFRFHWNNLALRSLSCFLMDVLPKIQILYPTVLSQMERQLFDFSQSLDRHTYIISSILILYLNLTDSPVSIFACSSICRPGTLNERTFIILA